MNNLVGCREIETLCGLRAISDSAHSRKWLGEADRWSDLEHRKSLLVFKISRCMPVPGPNPIEGNNRQKHESLYRSQSTTRGG